MLGLTFQIGEDRLAMDVRQIVEVIPSIPLQTVVGSPPWLGGACLFRGRVVPVIDLHRLVGAGACSPRLSTRIILVRMSVDDEERVIGLLAAQVADIRELPSAPESVDKAMASDRPDLGGVFVDDGQIFHLVDIDRLLPVSSRRAALAVTRELAGWT